MFVCYDCYDDLYCALYPVPQCEGVLEEEGEEELGGNARVVAEHVSMIFFVRWENMA